MVVDVSIIIVNYNTLELTKNTINSVIEKTRDLNYEIILVDNASTDGSVEFFEKEYKNKIIFIKNNENLGFGRANNKGIEIAKGKYIFLLNPDTLLLNNAIKIFFKYMEKNKEGEKLGVITSQALDKEKNIIPFDDEILTYKKAFLEDIRGILIGLKIIKLKNKKIEINTELGYACGAILFIESCILKEIGYFDEQFFMFYEETDLQRRIKKNGYKIYNILGPKIIHLESQSLKVSNRKRCLTIESKIKFLKKYEGIYKAFIYKIFCLILNIFKSSIDFRYTFKEKKEFLLFILRS